MKYFLFVLLIFFFNLFGLKGQYIINWAQIQPAWVFPLFLEDAHGQRDTIYFGFDATANPLAGQQDIVFGEQNFYVDTINLIGGNSNFTFVDSIQKVLVISDTSSFLFSRQFGFRVYNVYMPLIIRYDKSLFYNSNIPLADQSPLPRAQGVLNWFYYPNNVDCGDANVLITDTISNDPSGACLKEDSLIIENRFGDPSKQTVVFTFGVGPWTGFFPLGVDNYDFFNSVILSPNPATEHLDISSTIAIKNISIFNSLGQILDVNNIQTNEKDVVLDTSNWPTGLYFLMVDNGLVSIKRKFIILK